MSACSLQTMCVQLVLIICRGYVIRPLRILKPTDHHISGPGQTGSLNETESAFQSCPGKVLSLPEVLERQNQKCTQSFPGPRKPPGCDQKVFPNTSRRSGRVFQHGFETHNQSNPWIPNLWIKRAHLFQPFSILESRCQIFMFIDSITKSRTFFTEAFSY